MGDISLRGKGRAFMKKGGRAKDMSMKHEGMESMAEEAKETKLEKKGYKETKSGKMVKAAKGGLMKISKELKKSSKLHGKQSNIIAKMIKKGKSNG